MKKQMALGVVAAATACVGILATCSVANGEVGFGQKDPVVATGQVGFNATQSEFTLPRGLGLLPGPNLALAQSDPAYAAGLANANDWREITVRYGQGTADLKSGLFWAYDGPNPTPGVYSRWDLYIVVKDGIPVGWTSLIV